MITFKVFLMFSKGMGPTYASLIIQRKGSTI